MTGGLAEALWDRFRGKAEAIGAVVLDAPDAGAAARLLAASGADPVATAALAARFPGVAARWPRAARPSAEGPVASDVVTAAAFAVAETGSLGLVEGGAADRAACLLAERLWLLVPAREIEPTVDAGLARIAALVRDGARYATLVTGPSRTADIERVLTTGVHGPREVRVIVVREPDR